MSEVIYRADDPKNPFGVDVVVKSEGPMRTLYCQFCPKELSGPLHRARAQLLDHYEERHKAGVPMLHSFFWDENRSEAELFAWNLRRRGP